MWSTSTVLSSRIDYCGNYIMLVSFCSRPSMVIWSLMSMGIAPVIQTSSSLASSELTERSKSFMDWQYCWRSIAGLLPSIWVGCFRAARRVTGIDKHLLGINISFHGHTGWSQSEPRYLWAMLERRSCSTGVASVLVLTLTSTALGFWSGTENCTAMKEI